MKACLVGTFSKWVRSTEAVGNWVAAVWDLVNGLKITQFSDSPFLFRFVDKSQAAKVLQGVEDC